MPQLKPPLPDSSNCNTCPMRGGNMCHYLLDDRETLPQREHRASRPRQSLYRADTVLEHVHILCEGWAYRFVSLSGGRRMILAFLLPGDLISATAVFSDRIGSSVQMITAGRYCLYRREEFQRILFDKDPALSVWGKYNRAEQEGIEQKLADIGRRSAEERIARLILGIVRRLRLKGLQGQGDIPFPLTQQHIADAAGLTPIHVSRTLNVFRQKEIMSLSHGHLVIHDQKRLHHAADLDPGA